MGIANELSGEVAAAVLARKGNQTRAETEELIEIVRNFHSALRSLTGVERRRRSAIAHSELPPKGQAASGGN